jgi:bifunctional non-homologous end joining protein LigD
LKKKREKHHNMSLGVYRKKRNFKDTPEPGAKKELHDVELIFVVQRHHASHLHYDFRLELNGTLKSWAVPKGPSMNPKDKRLAMMVEDHPVAYAKFEGDIPQGNYGAGHVDIWDKGVYEPVDENGDAISASAFAKALKAGSIKFRIKGKKLKGEFALVKLKNDDKSWLLIKHRDKYATDEAYDSEAFAKKSSLAYTEARGKKKISKAIPNYIKEINSLLLEKKFRTYIKPMLAKPAEKAFDDEDWVYEIKWDGYRAIAEIKNKEVKLYSRNGLSFENKYPEIFEALQGIHKPIIWDGEIVALDDKGLPSFQLLQQYGQMAVQLVYYVFDCIFFNGKSLEAMPLSERKKILKKNLPESEVIKYCDDVAGQGISFFNVIKKKGLEGIIAKRKDSIYKEGTRSPDWLKIKHIQTQEAVIAGYTSPRGTRKYFGALILGVYEKAQLKYIGHTGTGFNERSLKELYARLQELKVKTSPFKEDVSVNAPVVWVKPELVCNIKFTEITSDGMRRHPVFMGIREDKTAKEVKMEFPIKAE